jgi:hypothetical protein
MIVQDLILNFFDKVGQPSDLSPYNYPAEIPTYNAGVNDASLGFIGWTKCLAFLNRAYKMLANWKTPQGRLVKFRELNQTFLWQNTDFITTEVVDGVDVSGRILTFSAANFVPNQFAMWFANINGFTSIVISNTPTTVTFRDAPTFAAVNGFPATFYKRWFPVVDSAAEAVAMGMPAGQYVLPTSGTKIISFKRIVNLTLNNAEILPASRTQLFWDLPAVRTHPMQYRFTNLGLEFDACPVDGDLLRILYYGEPELLVTDTQEPNIPAAWHELIWMIASWLRKSQDQNSEEANADAARINRMIGERIQQYEQELDEVDVGVHVWY